MKNLFKSFWFNVLLIVGICFLLYFAFFASLSRITHHGEELTVPKLHGKNAVQAIKDLEKMGFSVIVDSAYDTLSKPFQIIEVQPEPGSTVKAGRSIFVTISKANPPEVEMPNLLNLSLRSAALFLQNNKLILGDTTFKADMAKGAVLQQLFNGKPITAGTKLFQGSTIDLVVGAGYGSVNSPVPDLIGLPFSVAKQMLDSANLFYTDVWDGRFTDSSTATVYFQMPSQKNDQGYPNYILEGENIDIRIRQSQPKVDSAALKEK